MRFFTVRLRPLRLAALLCCVAVAIAGVTVFIDSRQAVPVFGFFNKGIAAGSQEERTAYINSCGWQAAETPLTEDEVIIPTSFDELYSEYNEIQKAQGFDLTKYRGKAVHRFCYLVTNFEEAGGDVVITLLVYKNKLIGADISSTEQGGFLRALS